MKNNLKNLLKENNELEKSLSKENNEAITNIILYIKFSNISQVDVELIRKDIIGMALESQLRGECFSKVIGTDYKIFADNLASNCVKEPVLKKILNLSFMITMSILSIFIFQFVSYVIKNKTFTVSLSLDFIISSLIGALYIFLMLKFILKNTFKSNKTLFLRFWAIHVILIAIFVVNGLLLRNIFIINVNFLFFLVFFIIIALSIYIIDIFYTNKILQSKTNNIGDI